MPKSYRFLNGNGRAKFVTVGADGDDHAGGINLGQRHYDFVDFNQAGPRGRSCALAFRALAGTFQPR